MQRRARESSHRGGALHRADLVCGVLSLYSSRTAVFDAAADDGRSQRLAVHDRLLGDAGRLHGLRVIRLFQFPLQARGAIGHGPGDFTGDAP